MVAVAIVGASVVGGAVSVAASSKASKTAKKTAAANNALQTDIYNQNKAVLAPYQGAGNAATPAIQALLGLGGGWQSAALGGQRSQGVQRGSPYSMEPAFEYNGQSWYVGDDGQYTSSPPQASGQSALDAQNQAFENFRNSTGYQDQFAEGQRAVTTALGNRGLLDSGAAVKAQLKYGQSQANRSFGDYYARLVGQQQIGLTAASAQAGVGQNYANNVSVNNNAAAETSANAALSNAGAINSVLQSGLSAYGYSQGLKSSYAPTSGASSRGWGT